MTLAPQSCDELATALEAYLALAGTGQPPSPALWIGAHDLLEVLKSGSDDAEPGRKVQAAAAESVAELRDRMAELRHEQETLAGMIIRNHEVAGQMQKKLTEEQGQVSDAWQSFTIARKLVSRQGAALQKSLGNEPLEKLLSQKLDEMLYSPTTAALTQAMQSLLVQATTLFDKSNHKVRQLGELVEAIHERFNALPGGTPRPPRPQPDLAYYRQALADLSKTTSDFCRSPMNLITDKASLVKKFGLEVVLPLRSLFARLEADTESWLLEPCNGLQDTLQNEKIRLEKREEDIVKIRDYLATLETRIADTEAELARLTPQEGAIVRILAILGAA